MVDVLKSFRKGEAKRIPDQMKVEIIPNKGPKRKLPLKQVHALIRMDSAEIDTHEDQQLYERWLAQNPELQEPITEADGLEEYREKIQAATTEEKECRASVVNMERRRKDARDAGVDVERAERDQSLLPQHKRSLPDGPTWSLADDQALEDARNVVQRAAEATKAAIDEFMEASADYISSEMVSSCESAEDALYKLLRKLGREEVKLFAEIDRVARQFDHRQEQLRVLLKERKRYATDRRADMMQKFHLKSHMQNGNKKLSDEAVVGYCLWRCLQWLGYPGQMLENSSHVNISPLITAEWFALKERRRPLRITIEG